MSFDEAAFKSLASTVVVKKWGREFWISNDPKYCLKLLEIDPGFRCSLHFHKIKQEEFVVLRGQVLIDGGDSAHRIDLTFGEWLRVPVGDIHRFASYSGALLLEISTHHSDSDVVRLSESGPIPDAIDQPRPPASFPKV